MSKDKYTPVARVAKLFGHGGGLELALYDTFPEDYGAQESSDGIREPQYGARMPRDGTQEPYIRRVRESQNCGTQSQSLVAQESLDHGLREPLFALIDGLRVPFHAETFSRKGKRGALVEFADMDTPERAAELVGVELSLCNEPEKADGTHEDEGLCPEDMIGFAVVIAGSELTGTITGYIDSEHNPLFVLTVGGIELFVPVVDEMIATIDPVGREVEFDLPDGLLELYIGETDR